MTWTSFGREMKSRWWLKYLSLPPEMSIPSPERIQRTSTKSWRCSPTQRDLSVLPCTTLKYLLPFKWDSSLNSVIAFSISPPCQ